jgi:aldehyde dehydrogenase (NAD+)
MDIQHLFKSQQDYFATHATKNIKFRIDSLKKLRASILNHEDEIYAALKADLNKSKYEAYMTEIGIVLSELSLFIKKLKKWAKPVRKRTPLVLFPAKSKIMYEPYGVTLIMSPWNYPFQLAIDPLIGAIGAGNTAIVKPGSYAKHTSKIIETIIDEVFDDSYVAVVQGGREENTKLLEQPFDYIFFTGSKKVGKIVMKSAAEHLTPVTLELGGKSPCIVDRGVDMRLTAKRIVFGKFINAGQTCVAPDYVCVHEDDQEELVANIIGEIRDAFGAFPLDNPNYPSIIDNRHKQELMELIDEDKTVYGGKHNDTSIEPTVMKDITPDHPVMADEIFGPILPVLPYQDITEAYAIVNDLPKPLAFYLFTDEKSEERRALRTCSFGGGTINDTIMHFSSTELGFGGVGESGMGRYHGKQSFLTFSNPRGVLKRGKWPDFSMRYQPYKNKKLGFIKKILK